MQGGRETKGEPKAASLGFAPRRVFLFGMAGPNEADLARVDVLLKRMAVACDERERETLLRETAALLGHRGAESALLVWQWGDKKGAVFGFWRRRAVDSARGACPPSAPAALPVIEWRRTLGVF